MFFTILDGRLQDGRAAKKSSEFDLIGQQKSIWIITLNGCHE